VSSIQGGEAVPLDLDPDAIAGALAHDTREPDVVALTGWFGDGPDDETVRLFIDPDLKVWIDIPHDQILHRMRRPGETEKFGEYSVVYVSDEFMQQPTISPELRSSIADGFLLGEFALSLLLPETIEQTVDRVAYAVRTTTMHTRHCPP
jgi:hypothetical protein